MPVRHTKLGFTARGVEMNLNETAARALTIQQAVVYDSDAGRAEKVADVLRELSLEPLLIDHSALMRAMVGYAVMSTLKRCALNTCGTRKQSAMVGVSPWQKSPVPGLRTRCASSD